MNQLSFPAQVSVEEIARKQSFGASITLCYEVAGLQPKQLAGAVPGFDKGQLSRWESGGEGVVWPKLEALMDACGNDIPVLWMLQRRTYDLHSLRRNESELERRLRLSEEENAALKRVLMGRSA